MPTSPEGYWVPISSVKQLQIFNDYHRFLLISGPKKSGKTLGCADKVLRHAWETDRARVGVFAKTVKLAVDGGCWTDLTDSLMQEWIPADMGMTIVTPPKVDGRTRQTYFEVSNVHGTVSRIVLNSLDYDDDIETVIRGKRYSMIWFNELSNFRSRKVFDISIDQLRCVHLPYTAHQWMGDTNPADEGDLSWIYKLWYGERADDDHADPKFRDELGLIEVMIPENPFLSEQERSILTATFRHDPDMYSRYIEGKWTSSSANSHFADVFRSDLHVIGEATGPRQEEWDILLPEENCIELITGWDIGSINHAISFIEPVMSKGRLIYKVLDEIVILEQKISLSDLTDMAMEKMDYWEAQIGKDIKWRHWSDKSSFDQYRPAAEIYDYMQINVSSRGRIMLVAAPKWKDSIRDRINMTRKLLYEDRLVVSILCEQTVAMFKGLRKGNTMANFVDRSSRFKHIFDAMTYPILAESPRDFLENPIKTGKARKPVVVMA